MKKRRWHRPPSLESRNRGTGTLLQRKPCVCCPSLLLGRNGATAECDPGGAVANERHKRTDAEEGDAQAGTRALVWNPERAAHIGVEQGHTKSVSVATPTYPRMRRSGRRGVGRNGILYARRSKLLAVGERGGGENRERRDSGTLGKAPLPGAELADHVVLTATRVIGPAEPSRLIG